MLHALLLASTSATVPDVIVFAASAVVILMGAVGVVTSISLTAIGTASNGLNPRTCARN